MFFFFMFYVECLKDLYGFYATLMDVKFSALGFLVQGLGFGGCHGAVGSIPVVGGPFASSSSQHHGKKPALPAQALGASRARSPFLPLEGAKFIIIRTLLWRSYLGFYY